MCFLVKCILVCVTFIALVLLIANVLLSRNKIGLAVSDTPSDKIPTSNRTTLRDCSSRYYTENLKKYRTKIMSELTQRVYRGEFQHMAAIGWTRSESKIDYLCGGSLIARSFVLTAAHCSADSRNIAPDTVRLGDTNMGSPEDDEFAQQIKIARFTTHPQYRRSLRYFDIAIIQLAHPAEYTEAVCNACLWREEEIPRERMDVIGFGATGFGKALSPTLQRVKLGSIRLSDCAERITVNGHRMPDGFRKDQFCAAGNGTDACEGDSGGPIGVKRYDVGGAEIPLVVGVVSFGTPCTVSSMGVYTKVSSFMDWIEQSTNTSFDYVECARSSICLSRVRSNIPVDFKDNYANNRFGLLWDEAETSSLYDCGGTLIDDQYLITLASCVTSSRGNPKYVAHAKKKLFAVTDVYVSPRYRPARPENNIALLKIAESVVTEVFRPACLWNRNIDGEWGSNLEFSAYGLFEHGRPETELMNITISVKAKPEHKCGLQMTNASDVVCFTNSVSLVSKVCAMDHGAPVVNGSVWGEPMFAYGLVSTQSKECGSNLFVTDVTPHIEWMESIIFHNRDQFLVFSE